jgi:hypothetical protein
VVASVTVQSWHSSSLGGVIAFPAEEDVNKNQKEEPQPASLSLTNSASAPSKHRHPGWGEVRKADRW